MNEYQKAFNGIKYQVVDSQADGYTEPRTVQDFCYTECELIQKLVDKATPKKVITKNKHMGYGTYEEQSYCPHCGVNLTIEYGYAYCHRCGQALDWSDEDE